ncbi:MAG: hypothetical protein AMXMBFR82_40360 [Candidatus Hydrogenedentota bacterium]
MTFGERLRAYAEKDGRGYPDWAVRYVPVVRWLQPYLHTAKPVLEIGANENGLARFAHRRTVVVDIARDHVVAARATQDVLPVLADCTALPFAPDAFAATVCMDTFEHVDGQSRDAAVREIVRVTSGAMAVGFPSGAESACAEARIREDYRRFCGRTIKWLEEHTANALPDAESIAQRFSESCGEEYAVAIRKNANLRTWTWTWRVLMCGWPGRGNAAFQVLLRWMTPLLCRMHFGPCYRAIVWVEPNR